MCFFKLGASVETTNSSFQKRITVCCGIYRKKVMKRVTLIFEQPNICILR